MPPVTQPSAPKGGRGRLDERHGGCWNLGRLGNRGWATPTKVAYRHDYPRPHGEVAEGRAKPVQPPCEMMGAK
jgi:hypothetical protein